VRSGKLHIGASAHLLIRFAREVTFSTVVQMSILCTFDSRVASGGWRECRVQ
jgi:hypothetical protein